MDNRLHLSHLVEAFPLMGEEASDPNKKWLSYAGGSTSMSATSSHAYKLYSYCYPPLALAAYIMIWRGRLLKHIQFFRETIEKYPNVIDLATGDGTLTKKALFPMWKRKVERLLVLDISESMLSKAIGKLPKSQTLFVHGDVMHLPFHSDSVECLTCFGGFNSFASGKEAMSEMARVLSPKGVLRGSVLFTPKRPWKRRVIDRFIRWGLQTEHVDRNSFQSWIEQSGLRITESKQFGDVFLFEVRRV